MLEVIDYAQNNASILWKSLVTEHRKLDSQFWSILPQEQKSKCSQKILSQGSRKKGCAAHVKNILACSCSITRSLHTISSKTSLVEEEKNNTVEARSSNLKKKFKEQTNPFYLCPSPQEAYHAMPSMQLDLHGVAEFAHKLYPIRLLTKFVSWCQKVATVAVPEIKGINPCYVHTMFYHCKGSEVQQ